MHYCTHIMGSRALLYYEFPSLDKKEPNDTHKVLLVLPWIFKHGTNKLIVESGLKVLFSAFFAIFSVFFHCPPSPEEAK